MTRVDYIIIIGIAITTATAAIAVAAAIMTNAYGQLTDYETEIDKCMTSLKAENPRPGHLLDCDGFMPMVPQMIDKQIIENSSEVNQKVEEYLTQRSLEAYTEEEMKQKIKDAGLPVG